jgi:2-polyprenyl-3-methyl-5-hydroxy-6-metoxy-1,4-benzoquinol methylase
MEKMLPDQLKAAWQAVETAQFTAEEFERRREAWLDEYRETWQQALLLEGQKDLTRSLLGEIAQFTGDDLDEVERRCRRAVDVVADDWRGQVDAASRESVERYYDQSASYIYDLMWWHALHDDLSPLGYVTALDFAARHGCRSYLDFGSGVGVGAILFARRGFDIALADISSTLLGFSRWRLELRGLPAQLIDLKSDKLPEATFDIITAMDVFEHLIDPVETIDDLHRAIKPGGFLFGRFHAEIDETHPQHIVFDFTPVFARLGELGFVEVWRDEWLWGHQVFQKQW